MESDPWLALGRAASQPPSNRQRFWAITVLSSALLAWALLGAVAPPIPALAHLTALPPAAAPPAILQVPSGPKPFASLLSPVIGVALGVGAAVGTADALPAPLPAPPALLATLAEAGAWLPPLAVTAALGALLAAMVMGVAYKVATAQEDLPLETIRGSPVGRFTARTGNLNTEGSLLDISQRRALAEDLPLWRIRLQLMKPVTWVPLICGVACGAAASGNFHWWNPLTIGQLGHVPFSLALIDMAKVLVAMFMSGPLLTGYTQTINDWYDREIDAINEPYRAIPSGRISGPQVIAQIWALLLSGLVVAAGLDYWAGHWFDGVSGIFLGGLQVPPILANAIFGSWVAYIYSAPPLKLKQSGWIGDYACGASYIALPWWCGQSLLGELTPGVMVLSVLYSIGGLGVAIVNDFKSVEGDRLKGLMSLTVQYGIDRAKWLCAGTINVTQLAVAFYLASIGETNYALAVFGCLVPQLVAQGRYLLKDPVKYDVKYQVNALPFFTAGIFCTALAMGHHQALLTQL